MNILSSSLPGALPELQSLGSASPRLDPRGYAHACSRMTGPHVLPLWLWARLAVTVAVAMASLALRAEAENPHWIWHPDKGAAIQTNEVRFFRKSFHLDRIPNKAPLSVAADDDAVIYVNG